jgi:FKBP-type peptidyl-prolyl cis-trans isomerase
MGKRLEGEDRSKMAFIKRKGKREKMREAVRDIVGEFVDDEILEALVDNDYVVKMSPKSSYVIEAKVERIKKEEEKEEEKTCRCNAKEDEDCICYFYNKKRVKELEEKMGKEKFRKKQLVDELTQILIEYDC